MKTNKRTTRTTHDSNSGFLADVELENNAPLENNGKGGKGRRPGPLQNRGNTQRSAATPTNKHRRNFNTRSSNREPLIKVGAMWLKRGQKGVFMSGTIDIDDNNTVKILVFKNEYKEETRHPDYVIYEVQEPNRHDVAESFNNQNDNDDVPF